MRTSEAWLGVIIPALGRIPYLALPMRCGDQAREDEREATNRQRAIELPVNSRANPKKYGPTVPSRLPAPLPMPMPATVGGSTSVGSDQNGRSDRAMQ